mgnify:CR=1 FL=1
MIRAWLTPICLVIFALVALGAIYIAEGMYKKCVPFAQKDVPDENDGNWTNISGDTEINENFVTRTRETYEHKTRKGLKLSVYHYFGQLVP